MRTNIASGPIVQTDYGYTGQRNLDEDIGLMDYKARFYSPVLNRFIQPDSIVPGIYNPQNLNRFSYVGNSPILYNDPSGHFRPSPCMIRGNCTTPWQDSDRLPTSIPQGNRNNTSNNISSPLVSPLPAGPSCSEANYCSASISSSNQQQGVCTFITFDCAINSLQFTLSAYSISQLSYTQRGSNLIIYGSRIFRSNIGINPFSNYIGLHNQPNLFSTIGSATSSASSPFTIAGIGVSTYSNYQLYESGYYNEDQFIAATTVDLASQVIIATISGAIAGAIAGTTAGLFFWRGWRSPWFRYRGDSRNNRRLHSWNWIIIWFQCSNN